MLEHSGFRTWFFSLPFKLNVGIIYMMYFNNIYLIFKVLQCTLKYYYKLFEKQLHIKNAELRKPPATVSIKLREKY